MTANIWLAVILLGLVLYVTLDGYDLGMGVLAIFQRDDADRRALLELVAPVWDGNESWILLIAVGMWGGFPAAYGAVLPSVYPVLILMVFSLIGRGVSIEMISNAQGWPRIWGRVFMAGSLFAPFLQGVAVGSVLQGIHLGSNAHFEGGTFKFFTGFTVLTGLTTVILYTFAGAAMVKMRSDEDGLRTMARRIGRPLALGSFGFVALTGAVFAATGPSNVSLVEPLRIDLLVGTCIVASSMFVVAWWALGRDDHDYLAFVALALTEVAGLIAIVVLNYPMIVPPSLTIAHAASPSSSLDFLLGGVGMLVPLVAAYNAYAFWSLRPRRARQQVRPVGATR
jgi:cytochrome d ubiquinol oxidase subunit II